MSKKILELTVEIEIQAVNCPGVWLCPNGHMSLTVFTLGTSYQTCCLPPTFPLHFQDLFYFRKRFQKICCINDMQLLLHDEMIYCELVQWVKKCGKVQAHVLAQYLGTLNEVLFPPQMCSNAGIDLLMRPAKHFPGILSPKIEVATKLRIDEIWDNPLEGSCDPPSIIPKGCVSLEALDKKYQKRVCHSPEYHSSPHCTASVKSGCTTKCKQSMPMPPCTTRPKSAPKDCYAQQEVSNSQCASCQDINAVNSTQFADGAMPCYNKESTISCCESNEYENYRERDENYPCNCTSKKISSCRTPMTSRTELTRNNAEESLDVEKRCKCKPKKRTPCKLTNYTDNMCPPTDIECESQEENFMDCGQSPSLSDDCDGPCQTPSRAVANDMCLKSQLKSRPSCLCQKYQILHQIHSYRKLSSPVPYTCEICKKYEKLFNNNRNMIKCCRHNC